MSDGEHEAPGQIVGWDEEGCALCADTGHTDECRASTRAEGARARLAQEDGEGCPGCCPCPACLDAEADRQHDAREAVRLGWIGGLSI